MANLAKQPDTPSASPTSDEQGAQQAAGVDLAFEQALKSVDIGSGRFWVAYSGGLDSTVLLHLAARHRDRGWYGPLSAIHVNHNIDPEAADWATHCQQQAAQWQIPITCRVLGSGELEGGNLEQRARSARYRLISQVLSRGDLLATAHHRRDQAETLLLQLFRGGGVRGTAAMGRLSRRLGLSLIRPLLDVDPGALAAYARVHQLTWIEDPSNQQSVHDRNYLRLEIMPRLRQRWPGIDQVLARTARLHSQTSELVEELAALDWQTAMDTADPTSPQSGLGCQALADLSTARRSNLLRYWLTQQGYPLPSDRQLQALQQSLVFSRPDRSPVFSWGATEVYRHRGALFVRPLIKQNTESAVRSWSLNRRLQFETLGYELSASLATEGLRMRGSVEQPYSVGFRRGGETMRLRGHRRSLKKLLQEWRVPAVERPRLPLIFAEGELVAVPGHAVADSVRVHEGEGWRVQWQATARAADPVK